MGSFIGTFHLPEALDFQEFAKFAFNEYGDRVTHWVTINESYEFSLGGYNTREKAAGRCHKYINDKSDGGDSRCEKCKDGKIGIIQSPMWFEPYESEKSYGFHFRLVSVFKQIRTGEIVVFNIDVSGALCLCLVLFHQTIILLHDIPIVHRAIEVMFFS
ncbi:unnamed protein product [Eruca vesicaria subsp. sativa]|uniref:thioglucosidase n=1 Tax=Eruca vesicaria subsp. sativa TaxID=29727 RepID=A0ABC8J3S8_ERUVS|nr:unnamed protein product [Eruca vesicaria subsp. sativa]